MKKKLTAFTLAITITLLFSCVGYGVYGAEENNGLIKIFKDFESAAPASTFDLVSGKSAVKSGGSNSDRCFLFDNGDRREMTTGTINLGKTINSGVLKVEFDYKVSTFTNNFYIRMVSTTGTMANTFCDRNTFTYYPNTTGWTIGDKRAAYNRNEWNTVSMYVNFDNRMVYYYKNGEMYGFTTLGENGPDAISLQFTCNGSYGNTFMDNLSIEEISSDSNTLPEEVKWQTFAQINSTAVGRIFWDKAEQSFIVTTGNKTDKAAEYVLKTAVLKSGDALYEEETQLSMEAGEVKDTEIKTHTDGFGYYFFDAKVYDKQGVLLADAEDVRFSVSNIPEEGVKNKLAGIQMTETTSMNENDMVQDLKLVAPLGFTYSRKSPGKWDYLQNEPYKFEVPKWQQYIVDQYTEYGLIQTPTAAFENYKITSENPPRSPEALEHFSWYAKELALYYHNNNFNHPREYVDIWNEFWMNGSAFNRDNNTPEDYAAMLKACYLAIKEASPETRVFGFSGIGLTYFEWGQRVLAAGGAEYMDGYSIHPYGNKTYPENLGLLEFLEKMEAEFQKYGKKDVPVWIGEWGWPSCGEDGYPDEMGQASYFVRAFVMNSAYDMSELVNWYGSNDLENDNGQESRFGLFRNQYAEVAYEAKPVYMTVANYHSLMTDAEFVDQTELGSNVTGYRFKLRDGRDCIVAWGVQFDESVAFKLDTDSVTVYDIYGNDSKLNSSNGKFSMSFDIMPQYIVGSFSKPEKAKMDISVDKKGFDIVKGDKAEITVIKASNDKLSVEVEAPSNISVVENKGFAGNKCKIVLAAENCERESDEITVIVKKDGKTVYSTKVAVNYIPPIDFSLTTKPYSSNQMDRWVAQIKIKGNFYADNPKGVLKVLAPSEMAETYTEINIPKIGPKQEHIIRLNIPKGLSYKKLHFEARLEMDGYQPLDIKNDVLLRCSPFARKKPAIDGKLDKNEWDVRAVMIMDDPETFTEASTASSAYTGSDDLSARVYTAWDYDNFYLAAEVTDDIYGSDPSLLWKSDGIQFAMAPSKTGTQMAQFDMAKIGEECFVEMEISTNAANIGPVENAEFQFTRNGTTSIYELKIPWKDIFPDGYNLRRNSIVPFSMLINDNDGITREGFMENGGGIGTFKNVYDFLDLFLLF